MGADEDTEVAFKGGIPAGNVVKEVEVILPHLPVKHDPALHANICGLSAVGYTIVRNGWLQVRDRPSPEFYKRIFAHHFDVVTDAVIAARRANNIEQRIAQVEMSLLLYIFTAWRRASRTATSG